MCKDVNILILFIGKGENLLMNLKSISVKGSAEWNEDAIILNDENRIYGVIDGATSIVSFRGENNETGGRLASQVLKEYFEKLPASENRSLEDLMKEANEILEKKMKSYNIQMTDEELWTAAIVLIRINEKQIEFLQSGDCMLYFIYEDETIRTVTRDHVNHIGQKSAQLLKQGLSEGLTSKKDLWEKVKPQIAKNKRKMNTLKGYSVINGKPEVNLFLESGKLNRIQLSEVLLITDGLFYPKKEVDQNINFDHKMVNHVHTKGLKSYIDWLLELENDDHDCSIYPRLKKSDDKSGVWIRFD